MNQEDEISPDSRWKGSSSGSPQHTDSTAGLKSDSSVPPIPFGTSQGLTFTSEDDDNSCPKRDKSTVEKIIDWLCSLTFASGAILAGFSNFVPDYNKKFAALLTAEFCIRLMRNWYRVQGVNGLLDDYNVGALGLFLALWTNNHERVIRRVNLSLVGCRVIVYSIQILPHSLKLLIGRILLKFVGVKNRRDRYEHLGIAGLLSSNEAVNKKTITPAGGWYYSLENHHAMSCNEAVTKTTESITDTFSLSTNKVDAKTRPGNLDSSNTSDGNAAKAIEFAWKIGTMLVSYSDNLGLVTIMQKAEDRAVRTYRERFTEQQKGNFILFMKAWEDRPEQGILRDVLDGRINWHCLTLSRLIGLTKQGYSVCKVKTNLANIIVGAEVDAIIEDYIDSIQKIVDRLGIDSIWEKIYRYGMKVCKDVGLRLRGPSLRRRHVD